MITSTIVPTFTPNATVMTSPTSHDVISRTVSVMNNTHHIQATNSLTTNGGSSVAITNDVITSSHGSSNIAVSSVSTISVNEDSSSTIAHKSSSTFTVGATSTYGINNTEHGTNGRTSITFTSKPTSTPNGESSDGTPNTGAIIGGTLGTIFFIAMIIAILVFIIAKRKQKAKSCQIIHIPKAGRYL